MSDMQPSAETGSGGHQPGLGLEDYLGCARGHGETTDTRQWVEDLEDMLRIAWELMTPEQRAAFRDHPDILAIAEAAGGAPSQP